MKYLNFHGSVSYTHLDVYKRQVYVWGAEYMTPASAHRVQLGDPMSIQVQYTSYVQGLGIFRIPVTMTVTHSGLSERYWK